jgi:hypothetical protein
VGFGIIAPVLITLVIGILYLCMCLFVIGNLHYAVEDGARCASVRTSLCNDATTIVSYTGSHYFGPSSMPATGGIARKGIRIFGKRHSIVGVTR